MGKILIGLILGSLITFVVYRIINPSPNLSQGCQSAGGKWLGDFKECEWTFTKEGSPKPESVCQQLNGSFNGCASSCRHQPGYPKIACLTVCAMVCKFN
jgi:hypothetical protein